MCAHRQRVEIADARAALSKERIAASKAATDAALTAASTAAHGSMGLDTCTAVTAGPKRPSTTGRLWPSASVPQSVSCGPGVGVAAAAVRCCNSTLGGASSKAGRKLRRIVDQLQQDQGRGKKVSATKLGKRGSLGQTALHAHDAACLVAYSTGPHRHKQCVCVFCRCQPQ